MEKGLELSLIRELQHQTGLVQFSGSNLMPSKLGGWTHRTALFQGKHIDKKLCVNTGAVIRVKFHL